VNAGSILRYARRHAGLSQRQLAERAGVPQPAIARIESNAVSPRIDTLERLLAAAGTALEMWPRAGAGVDRTMMRAALQRTPEERIAAAAVAARNLGVFRKATRGTAG
jgi:transcriptional regulator with XRE-family HTH domain